MSTPIKIRSTTRGPVTVNAQSLVIIVFLIVIVYVLFSGGSKEERDDAEGPAKSDLGDLYDPLSAPQTPNTQFTPTSEPPLSEDEEVLYDPRTLRKLNPDAPHTPILRRNNSGLRRKKSVSFNPSDPDGPLTVKTHPDGMMRGEGRAEREYVPPEGYREIGKKPPEAEKQVDISLDLNALKYEELFKGIELPQEVEKHLQDLDKAADIDCRGRTANDPNASKYGPNDPLKDGWDSVWGILPAIGLDGAARVAAGITPADVNDIVEMLGKRAKIARRDSKRSIPHFLVRSAPNDGGKLTPERLAIGWFADTYRNVDTTVRMSIDNTFVNMHAELPTVSRLLQWLEGFARRLWRQRILSTGVDLDGCAMRLAIPSKRWMSVANQITPTYRYELQLHVFFWGGPVADTGPDHMDEWMMRLGTGCSALRTALKEIHNMMKDFGEPSDVLDTKVDARRVLFRPGFTTLGINNGKLKNVQQGLAGINELPRIAIPVVFPSNIWSALPPDQGGFSKELFDDIMSKTNDWIRPQISSQCNLRQHQWSKDTMTEENGKLSREQLLLALRAASTTMCHARWTEMLNRYTVETLDLGSFIPLVDNTTIDGPAKFFPLDDFRALKKIIMPYMPAQPDNPKIPSTTELLTRGRHGLGPYLRPRRRAHDEPGPPGKVDVEITCSSAYEKEFRDDMVLHAFPEASRLMEAHLRTNPDDRQGARRIGRDAILAWLKGGSVRITILGGSQQAGSRRAPQAEEIHQGEIEWPMAFREP